MEHPNCLECQSRARSVFSYLSMEGIEVIDKDKTVQEVSKGDVIFRQGSYPKGLYCISKGKVKITQTGSEGKEQIVHLAKDGDLMGFRAILGDDIYSCSGVALENSQICFIPRNTFVSIIEQNPKLTLQLFKLFSNMLKETEATVTHIAQKNVKERIAETLLVLKDMYGLEKDDATINIKITREEIANIAGTSRETAIRLLSDLNEEKIIELKGKKIKILRLQALHSLAKPG